MEGVVGVAMEDFRESWCRRRVRRVVVGVWGEDRASCSSLLGELGDVGKRGNKGFVRSEKVPALNLLLSKHKSSGDVSVL